MIKSIRRVTLRKEFLSVRNYSIFEVEPKSGVYNTKSITKINKQSYTKLNTTDTSLKRTLYVATSYFNRNVTCKD